MARVVGHLSVAELQAGYRGGGDATRARHHQVIWLLAQGRTVAETARLTSFARRWIEALLARYNAFGPSSLGDRRGGNGAKATILTPEVLDKLRERVTRPPDDGGVWTSRKVAEEAARHPGAVIEAFATDEHRIGLKPILRRVWAPRGERPVAVGHHRFEWLYVTAFVSPATGENFWYLSTGVSKRDFEDVLALFAREAGAGPERIIVLVLDNAGWHSVPGLAVPDGIRLVHLPPYTPELQPAETLWTHVDEPAVNRHFDTLAQLDAAVARQCVALHADPDRVRGQAGFHWWPARVVPI